MFENQMGKTHTITLQRQPSQRPLNNGQTKKEVQNVQNLHNRAGHNQDRALC